MTYGLVRDLTYQRTFVCVCVCVCVYVCVYVWVFVSAGGGSGCAFCIRAFAER